MDAIADDVTQGLNVAAEKLGRTAIACRIYYDCGAREGRWPPRVRKRVWTEERDAQLLALLNEGVPTGSIARQMGVTVSAIHDRCKVLRHTGQLAVRVVAAYTPASEDAVDSVWQRAEAQTGRDVEKHQKRRFASVSFPGSTPIGLAFVSDQHIRLTGPVALKQMRQDAELIRKTPGLHAILGGDAVDNHIVISQAMVRGGSKPAEEWRLFEHYLGMFGDPGESKVLAVISGNHDDWTIDKAGVDVLGMLVKQQRLHYSPFEVVLSAAVGSQTYTIKCRHRYSKYGSSFNPSHKVKRLWEMGDDDFDVGVVCHDHEPTVEPFWKHGRKRVAIRPGSYQFTSSYAETHGFRRYAPSCPTVVLFPDEHLVVPFDSVAVAAEYLTLLRKRVA